MGCFSLPVVPEMAERQEGFIPPNLSPVGLKLNPRELADGVYALVANEIPKDNNGVILGDRAALVIDSGITPSVGKYIQEVVSGLTALPIRYLINTTYHGDHTFGNAAFSDEVMVVSSRLNKASMVDLEEEKELRAPSMYGDPGLEEIVNWRKPDAVFDRYCEIDLGGRTVELWHFGPGNGSGDTLVYVPDAKVAWVGNFLRIAGIPPMLLAGDPIGYARSIRAVKATLSLDTLVPGHGPLCEATTAISWHLAYLERLAVDVAERRDARMDVKEMLQDVPLIDPLEVPEGMAQAQSIESLLRSNHELNVLLAYRWLAMTSAR